MQEERIQTDKTQQSITNKANYIEVWEDLVDIKEMVISLILCSTLSLAGYYFAPQEPPFPLFMGLGGAVIGFLMITIRVKPKRNVTQSHDKILGLNNSEGGDNQ